MNRKTTRTNMNRKFFAMFLVASLVISLFAVGFTASADTGTVSPSDALTSGIVTATDTVETDTVSAADTPIVSESDPMMFAAEPSPTDIASGECGTCSWIIDAEGVLTIYPTDGTSGTLASGTSASQWPWHSYRSSVTKVVAESGVVCGSSCAEIFRDMRNCTVMNLGGLNTSNVTAMNNMFQDCFALTTLDISNFNTSNATTMSRMFVNCESLITADVSGFDTSNVISMDDMFYNCTALTSLDVSNFKTSKVVNMSDMFYRCGKLTTIDVSKWDTSSVVEIGGMFNQCSSVTSLDVSGFKTDKVSDASFVFAYCRALTSLDLSGWNTSSFTNTANMFYYCRGLTSLNLSGWNTPKVTNMSNMFKECRALTSLDLSGWNTSNVTTMSDMFYYCSSLNEIKITATWKPASDYTAESYVNFFNAVDGKLICTPKSSMAIKSVTVDGEEVEFDFLGGEYDGFTGNSKAVITFAPARTVTFMDNGTQVEQQTVAQGGDAKDPYADESKIIGVLGKHFTGWDKIFTNIQQNLTVYAQYAYNDYVVVFDANGGEGTITPQAFKYGTSQNLSANTFTKEDATFVGWNTAADGSGTAYSDKASVKNLTDEHSATVTLYAQWKDDVLYTVVFDANGGEGTMAPQAFKYGTSQNLSANTFTKEDSSFVGWNTAADGSGTAYSDKASVKNLTDEHNATVTLYAQWKDDVLYTVVFDANGGEGTMTPQSFKYGTSQRLSANTFTNGDLNFAGWNTKADGSGTAYSDKASVLNLTDEHNATVTLYAQWKLPTYTVTFMVPMYDMAIDEIEVEQGDSVIPPEFPGTILGWVTEKNGTTEPDFTNITEDMVVWAILRDPITGTPSVEFEKSEKVFDIGEEINFTAIGVLPENLDYYLPINGDALYMPMSWSSDDLSGDWDDAEDFDDCVAAFSRDTAGEYVLKVEFIPLIVEDLTMKEGEPFTVEVKYTVGVHTVTFKDSTDDSVIDEITVAHGKSATAPTAPVHEGFEFVRWATEKDGETEADFTAVTGDMTVWAVYEEADVSRDPYTGAPSVSFDKESKTFNIDEEIKFKAVGYWADSSTTEFIDGDERYVPTNWHHAEPSGDFGGKTAPTDTYSASFKQSAAGTYTLKVEFAKSVYADGAWVDDGIVTVETEYKVVAPSAGDTDSPQTGDSNNIVIIASNIMFICAAGMYLVWRTLRKKENA